MSDILAILVMSFGALVQGAVGFGANLFAAPLLVLIDPTYVPGPVIVASVALNGMGMQRAPGAHHWRAIRWPLVGQVAGVTAAAAVLSILPTDAITLFFAGVILAAVALSLSGLHPRRTTRNLVTAGAASGFMGTAVGIGGPPIALISQEHGGEELRGELSRFFMVGSLLGLAMLAAFGQLTWDDVARGLLLVPGAVLGFWTSRHLLHVVDRAGNVRKVVLVLSTLSALAAVAKVVLG